MIAILSPAKTIDESEYKIDVESTTPRFLDSSEKVMGELKKLEMQELSSLMKINDKLAELNFFRNQNWEKFSGEGKKPAILSFKGEAYRGLAAEEFDSEDLIFCNDNLRILSGLYGSLRPLDGILPYRLEMGTKMKIGDKKNLYDFWSERLTRSFHEELESHEEKVIVNLASDEYSKVLKLKSFNVLNITFKERKNGEFKIVTMYAKKARGMMVNYIVLNKIEKVEELKDFDMDGYKYNPLLSKDDNFVFTRE